MVIVKQSSTSACGVGATQTRHHGRPDDRVTIPLMRFAISIPQLYGDGEFDPGAFRDYCAAVEDLGFDSGWTQEQVLGRQPQLGPIETMTYAAACTQRMRLGCVVFVSTLHSPVHLAKSMATLDQLSGGRIDMGVGTGGKGRPFAAFGISADRYVARFTEGVELMKALWTEPSVTFDGEFWQLKEAGMEPKPVQKPYPPLWFGANSEPALRRAVRLGDGFFGAGSCPTDRFADQVGIVRTALAEQGRDPAGFPIAKRLYVAVDDNAERARERINAALAGMYGRRVADIEAAAVAGPPAVCAAEVARVAAAGAELILFTTLFDQPLQAGRLAAEVIPLVG
jgi:probable F420-dependent oxidoreductase